MYPVDPTRMCTFQLEFDYILVNKIFKSRSRLFNKMKKQQTFSYHLEFFFRAASTGEIDKFRIMEKWPVQHAEHAMKELAQKCNNNGETALALACKFGHLNVVRYLVEQCRADVNQISKLWRTYDGHDDCLGTALHAAVKAGYLDIVRYLVQDCKADLDVPTETKFLSSSPDDLGNTPLHTAVFELTGKVQEDIIVCLVKNGANMSIYNNNGNPCWAITSDVDVIKLLIELGLDVNKTTDKVLESVAHVWARSIDERAAEVLELLIAKGANMEMKNYEGLTPLMVAAVGAETERRPNENNFLVMLKHQEPTLSRLDKILAFELIGATKLTGQEFQSGLSYWIKAMELRWNFEDEPPIPKPVVELTECAKLAYATREFETLEQLEDRALYDPDSMKVQALLTYHRILGVENTYLWSALTDYAIECWTWNESQRFVNFSMLVLECSQTSDEPMWYEMVDTTRRLILSFYLMYRDPIDREIVTFSTVMTTLHCSVTELIRSEGEDFFIQESDSDEIDIRNILLDCVIQLSILLASMLPTMTEDQSYQFKKCLYQVVQLNLRNSQTGRDLLLLACDSSSRSFSPEELFCEPLIVRIGELPSANVISLLLEVGANPESTDMFGNTGLHILAKSGQSYHSSTIKALFEGGAHLDTCNLNGQTMADILHGDVPREPNTILSNPLEFPRLKCLAARAILHSDNEMGSCDLSHAELFGFVLKH